MKVLTNDNGKVITVSGCPISAPDSGSLIENKTVKGGTFTVNQSYYSAGGSQTISHGLGTTPKRIVVFSKESASSISDNWTWILNENQNYIVRANSHSANAISATNETFTITFPALSFNPQGTYYWVAMD